MYEDLVELNAKWTAAALSFEEAEQVPFALNVNGPFFTSLMKVDTIEYYTKPELQLETQLQVRERFGGLTPIVPDMGVASEPSALGAKLEWVHGTAWAVPFINKEEDVEKLEVPDIMNAGVMTQAFKTYRYMREKLGPDFPISFCSTHSPWGVANLIRGTTELMTDLISNPGLVKKLLRKTTELGVMWLKAQAAESPQGTLKRVMIWDDLSSFVSLRQFREFILPIYEELYGLFPGCERWYHNDANASGILDGLMDAGIQCFHYGYEVDPVFAKEKTYGKICLMGNIPPLHVLRNGRPQDVDNAVKEVIAKSAKGGGLIVAAGGFIDEGTPAENLDAMIKATLKYGRRDTMQHLVTTWQLKLAEQVVAPKPEEKTEEPKAAKPRHPSFDALQDTILYGRFKEIQDLLKRALEQGANPRAILDDALIPGLDEVGKRFSEGLIFMPEMLTAARAMKMALEILNPLLVGSQSKRLGTIAIGTVREDQHDIGKNIVISLMQGGGLEVVDLGVDCPPEKFVEAARDGADLIGLSAILTTVLPNVDETVRTLERSGFRDKVKILLGGAAMTPAYAAEVGADAYCKDAGEGVMVAKRMLKGKHGISGSS